MCVLKIKINPLKYCFFSRKSFKIFKLELNISENHKYNKYDSSQVGSSELIYIWGGDAIKKKLFNELKTVLTSGRYFGFQKQFMMKRSAKDRSLPQNDVP
jgi:hypothetical protein